MSSRSVLLLGVVLAAGCSSGGSDNPARAECERESYNDPAVAEVYARTDGNYTYAGTTARDQLVVAQRDALQRCLRAKGLLPPGGVQPVRPRI